jgi:hypothetical protein
MLAKVARRFLVILIIALTVNAEASWAGPTTAKSNPFTGEWVWVIDFTPGLEVAVTSNFTQEGNSLRGSVEFGARSRSLQITVGKIDGRKISFTVTEPRSEISDLLMTCKYSGVLEGEKIVGKLQLSGTDPTGKTNTSVLEWKAERITRKSEGERK